MKVRHKSSRIIGYSSNFDVLKVAEVYVTGFGSIYIGELEIYLEKKGCWVDMQQAFQERNLIISGNGVFYEPRNETERINGNNNINFRMED